MCLSIVAFCFPPLAVCFKRGCGGSFCLAILLTLLGWFPGCLFACHIIHQDERSGGGNTTQVTNVTVAPAPPSQVTVNMTAPAPYPGPMGQYPPNAYPMPMGAAGPQYPPQNMPPPNVPPMYNPASAPPPYYADGQVGQGDNMQK